MSGIRPGSPGPVAPKRKRQVEHEEQCKFFAWVRLHPDTRDLLIYAIPNSALGSSGTLQDMLRVKRSKAEGLLPGVPDICIAEPRNGHPGAYIEMKRDDRNKNGTQRQRPSPAQLAILAQLEARGYRVGVCYSAVEAFAFLAGYFGLTR